MKPSKNLQKGIFQLVATRPVLRFVKTTGLVLLLIIGLLSLLAPFPREVDEYLSFVPSSRAAADFKTQLVKIDIPASTDTVDATAPTDFTAVTPANTIALIAGATQLSMGWIQETNQDPNEISSRVELIDGSTIRVTRSSSSIAQISRVYVLLIEYTGTGGGANEFIVRDRTTNVWTGGTTTDSYGPVSSVVDTSDVVVFSGGVENLNTSIGATDTGLVRASIDGTKTVNLARGDGAGAIESHHQVVEFTGSNWTIQTGTAAPAPEPGGTDVAITDVGDVSDVWVYFTASSDSGNLDEVGHRAFLTSTTNLRIQEHAAATGTKTIRWHTIQNSDINVQDGTADNQFSGNTTATITGFTSVSSLSTSFAWVQGMTNGSGTAFPRPFWQAELSDASTISLERGRSGQNFDYHYQVVELPIGNAPILDQVHYHWRNDDGTESGATSATSGTEDTALVDLDKEETIRLRMEVDNTGTADSSGETYRLEYGVKATTCSAIASWIDVGAGGGDWDMSDSTSLTDGSDTTNIAVGIGGVTDAGTTFETPNGGVKDISSTTGAITLSSTEFVELEYAIEATSAAPDGEEYCFRVTNAGTALDAYSVYPEVNITPPPPPPTDFKVQRGSVTVSGTSATITAGVDYDAPSSLKHAFIRITNTQHTGAGDNASGGTQNADDVFVYISNPGNLLTSITFTRPATAISNTHVDWEILEYVGPSGGAHEFLVRDQGTTTYGSASTTASTGTIAGIEDDADMVGWITGQLNPDTGAGDYNTGLSTADWDDITDEIAFTRGEAGGDAVIVSWAAIEFIGDAWVIQRAEHTYTSSTVNETESITAVNDLSRAFIHAQKRVGTGLQGIDEVGHEVWLSAVGTVSFRLQNGSTTPSGHTSVAWVIENTQTTDNPMIVTRSSGTQAGGPEPSTVSVSIGKTLDNLENASIFTNNRSTGTGTAHPRAMMGVTISDEENYELFISDTGQTRTFRTEVVEWPDDPNPPGGGGGGGSSSPTSFVSNIEFRINENDECTDAREVVLSFFGENVKEIIVSNNDRFIGSDWQPFSPGMEIEWLLEEMDGLQTVYALFRSPVDNLSSLQSQTILLDEADGCGSVLEEEGTEAREEMDGALPGEPIEVPGPVCALECEKISYDLYIVNPDGTERHMGSEFAKVSDLGGGASRIYFEDRGDDFDLNDLVFRVDFRGCQRLIIRKLEVNAAWEHEVRLRILYDGIPARDFLLWPSSRLTADDTRLVDLGDFPNICLAEGEVEDQPEADSIIVYELPGFEGRSEQFFPGEKDVDLFDNVILPDTISSVQVLGKAVVVLFDEILFGGRFESFFESDEDLSDNLIGDNVTSSLIVTSEGEETAQPPILSPLPEASPREEVSGCAPRIPLTAFMEEGSIGEEVRVLQEVLQCLGFFPADTAPTAIYGPITAESVTAFQRANNIDPLGIVGPATRAAVNRQ